MGKIFDALEKSKKENTRRPEITKPVKKIGQPDGEAVRASGQKKMQGKKKKMDRNLVTLFSPRSFASEQFKRLRTSLLFPKSGVSPRTIMVTSAAPSEGKSFVAANLALSIAQNINEHVLLIDCDMRNPCVHTMFGFSRVRGLSDYLANGTPLHSVLLKSPVEKLSILPVGDPPHNPAELLSSEKMSDLLKEVKTRYNDRYIIVDLPPPNFTAEANALARQVDGILLVIQYGGSRREIIKDMIASVGKEKILGVVLNRFDDRMSGNYRYRKYNKYLADYAGHV